MKTIQQRFDAKYIPEPNSGCWLWTAAVCSGGYGCIGEPVTRKILCAHRVSWGLHRGMIPDGQWVLHKCDVRACVNPDHLFLGTVQDNGADMAAKGRSLLGRKIGPQKNPGKDFAVKGEGHHFSKLSENQAIEILKSKKKGTLLASKFGVSTSVISEIRSRKAWKHLEA
jgi:HNH endonuclease